MQSQPMHRSWEIDALASSELLKSEQPLRSKDQKQTPWLACDLSGTQIRQEPLSSYRCALSFRVGGGERDRTDDLLLAKQALSQLSYTPDKNLVGLDGFEPSTPALSRRCSNQLSYRPYGNRGQTPIFLGLTTRVIRKPGSDPGFRPS